MYSISKCVGFARALSSSAVTLSSHTSLAPATFKIIADSGATGTMIPWRDLFLEYKSTSGIVMLF